MKNFKGPTRGDECDYEEKPDVEFKLARSLSLLHFFFQK
jgi:hypothetical protein